MAIFNTCLGKRIDMVSTLVLGAILTLLAWVALQVTVIHGKYVVDHIADGTYNKGPLADQSGRDSDE